jgi:RNA polymerase sigma-70 factor (ECF subfamily)
LYTLENVTLEMRFDSVLEAARFGAPWAWSTLYGEIARPVAGFFRSRGVSDPESATGDVFFELSRNLETFVGDEDSFTTLVFAIAYKRLSYEDLHPRRRPRTALADKVLDHLESEIEVHIDDTTPRIADSVRTALQVLKPEQRDVLCLRVVAGLTVEQTAEVVGSDVSTVKTLQRKALARIRGAMPTPVTT